MSENNEQPNAETEITETIETTETETPELDELETALNSISSDGEELLVVESSSEEEEEPNPVLPKGYEEYIAIKIQTFPSTRCYGCNKVLTPSDILTDFFISSKTGGIAPYKCPNDGKVSFVHDDFK